MPLWALIALSAGTLQTARNALARSLAFQLSPALNTWARFPFNLPYSGPLVLLHVRHGLGGWGWGDDGHGADRALTVRPVQR